MTVTPSESMATATRPMWKWSEIPFQKLQKELQAIFGTLVRHVRRHINFLIIIAVQTI
jgi:hypothetical protein